MSKAPLLPQLQMSGNYTYDNVVGLLNYENDDIFGVEIYSQKLARQQTQLFDLLWGQAKPLN